MSQISPPVRILLVGCVLFLAAWMTVLKPKDEAAPAPAPAAAPATPAVAAGGEKASTSLGKAVESANNASKAQTAANARHGDESQAAGETAPAAAAKKAPATSAAAAETAEISKAGLPMSVAKAVAENKVLVLLFWNPKAADDRAVRRELRSVGSRHRKEVVVHVADVKNISRYAAVTRGANVEQSPSVVVVDGQRQATVLEGYSDRETIRQAVYDALRSK